MASVRAFVLFSFTSPPSSKASQTPEFVNYPLALSRSAASAVILQKTWKPINRQLNGLSSESCRRTSSKRKQELNPSHSDQQPAEKMRCINPDTPRPSIEIASDSQQDIIFEEDNPDCELRSTPIFIHEGVFVGFWFADGSGNGRRPVHCLVERGFEFAYLKGNTFVLVRYDDFDPLDDFGDWLGDDTEDEDAMSPEEVKVWVEMMWESRVYAGLQDMTFEN